ncbi:MAG: 3-phosphoserine/phosphohydroxythreonine transaminase [Candidatus Hydrogenedentota bacterium]
MILLELQCFSEGVLSMYGRVYNFNPGPAVLPESVLEKARDEMMNYKGTGISVMEMSHRSKEFEEIIQNAEASVRRIMNVPDNYDILFLQGGASLQFAMVPMNLYIDGKPVDVIHTGAWTKKAIGELKRITQYSLAWDGEPLKFSHIPTQEELKLEKNASYVHICSNNTIFGTQWREFPATGEVPLVADMSSDIMSRVIDVSLFGLIFAGVQKNVGSAGATLVIIRKDLVDRCKDSVSVILQYKTHIKEKSLYHTPPCYAIYISGLVLGWIEKQGGLSAIEKINEEKARILYDAIDSSDFYYATIKDKESRSRMNVNYRIKGNNEELEDRFVKEAKKNGLVGLKGHRSVGGLRASLYNALSIDGVKTLVEFMNEFAKKNG